MLQVRPGGQGQCAPPGGQGTHVQTGSLALAPLLHVRTFPSSQNWASPDSLPHSAAACVSMEELVIASLLSAPTSGVAPAGL